MMRKVAALILLFWSYSAFGQTASTFIPGQVISSAAVNALFGSKLDVNNAALQAAISQAGSALQPGGTGNGLLFGSGLSAVSGSQLAATVAAYAAGSATPFSATQVLSTNPAQATGTTTLRSLQDRFADLYNVRDFGAKCDSTTDDSAAFLAALTAGGAAGKPVVFTGKCRVGSAVNIAAEPASGALALYGFGAATILTSGNDVFNFSPAGGTGIRARIDLHDFTVTNTSATNPNMGQVLVVDCSLVGDFCTQAPSVISGLQLNNIYNGFVFREANGFAIHDIADYHANTSMLGSLAVISGSVANGVQGFSADFNIADSHVVGGYAVQTIGGVQDIVVRHVNLLVGQWGFIMLSPAGVEGITVDDNYFEGALGGISIPSGAFAQVFGNSFDAPPSGVASTWEAIVVGTTTKPFFGAQIGHNQAFGLGGATTGTVYYLNASNGSTVDANSAIGTVNTAYCMQVGAYDATPNDSSPTISMTGNSCWESGVMAPLGTILDADANSYTHGTANQNVDFNMHTGSGVRTDTDYSRILNGGVEIGNPGVVMPNGSTGAGGLIDLHDSASSDGTLAKLNDYDVRLSSSNSYSGTAGTGRFNVVAAQGIYVPQGTSSLYNAVFPGGLETVGGQYPGVINFQGQNLGNIFDAQIVESSGTLASAGTVTQGAGILDFNDQFTRFNSPILAKSVRFYGNVVPASITSACNIGDTQDAVVAGVPLHLFCYATNSWSSVPLSTGAFGTSVGGTGTSGTSFTAATDVSANPTTALNALTSRSLALRFTDHLSVLDYGAKCDGVTDDSAAFLATSNYATAHPRNSNAAWEIDVPAGRCVLNSTWAVTYATANTALRIHGDGSSHTELQFNNGINGIYLKFAANAGGNEMSRDGTATHSGQGVEIDGIHFLANTAQVAYGTGGGGGESGTAVSVIGIPLTAATNPPLQIYHDLEFSNTRGWDDRANNWAGGLYLQDADNVDADDMQFFDHALAQNVKSVPYWIHSTAALGAIGHGMYNFSNMLAFGGNVAMKLDGNGIQGVTVSHFATAQVQQAFQWLAAPNSLSGSLTFHDNSIGAQVSGLNLTNVSTVFSHDNFYYNTAPPVGTNPVFFQSAGGTTVRSHHDTFYGPLPGYEGTGFKSTALAISDYGSADVDPSMIDGDMVSHFDVGYSGSGGQIDFKGDSTASDTTTCYTDAAPSDTNPTRRPTFDGMQCGHNLNTNDGAGQASVVDWQASGHYVNSLIELGLPGITSPGGIPGYAGGIDFHSVASSDGTLAGLNDNDARIISSSGVAGTASQGLLDVYDQFTRFNSAILVTNVHYNGNTAPTLNTSSCNAGDTQDAVINGTPYHLFCYANNSWSWSAMSTGTFGAAATSTSSASVTPFDPQTVAAYSVPTADCTGTMVQMKGSAAAVVTIGSGLTNGCKGDIEQDAAGAVSVVPGSGMTMPSSPYGVTVPGIGQYVHYVVSGSEIIVNVANAGIASAPPVTTPTPTPTGAVAPVFITASQTLTASNCNTPIDVNSSSAVVLTMPSGLTSCRIRIMQFGTGSATLTPAANENLQYFDFTSRQTGTGSYKTAGQWASFVATSETGTTATASIGE